MRRKTIILTIALLVFPLCWSSVSDNKQVSAQQGGDQNRVVVFCVTSPSGVSTDAVMEPVLILEKGAYATPIGGDSDPVALTEFAKTFYRPGHKYQLVFGGANEGHVTVENSMMDSECFRAGAKIKLSARGIVKLNRNVMALATNVGSMARTQSFRRAPTPSERTEALRLARQVFVAKGSPAAILPTLEVVNLTAINLDDNDKAELIGTFVLKKTKGGAARFVLFLIAEPHGKGHRAAITNYERFTDKDIMSGGSLDSIGADGIYTERLVDQIDLDANGTGEVITITNSFEGVTYKLYKKQAGMWKSVYEFNSYRCGF